MPPLTFTCIYMLIYYKQYQVAKETAEVQSATSGYNYTYGQTGRILC